MPPITNISTTFASLICIGFTLIYVAGFYVFNQPGSRNDPHVIKARMKAVTVASALSALIVYSLLYYTQSKDTLWQVLGLTSIDDLYTHLQPLVAIMMLFLGSLSILFFDQELPCQKHFSFERDVKEVALSLIGQRNYIVGPITEEFVFRACIIAVLSMADYSRTYLIFASPLYFGIAHLHHVWDIYNKMGKTQQALKNAILSCTFQFLYTTIFGWYVSYLFLKTSHLLAPILCHSFCNIMGFPDFSYINHRPFLQKLIIYACFPIGIYLFIYSI